MTIFSSSFDQMLLPLLGSDLSSSGLSTSSTTTQASPKLEDIQRAVELLEAMNPPPPTASQVIEQWMREQNTPPEEWTAVLPMRMKELFGPFDLVPAYVSFSDVAVSNAYFVRKGIAL